MLKNHLVSTFLTNQDIILKIVDQLKSIEIENICEVGPWQRCFKLSFTG
jgi:16S rRNA A1518/A1519 N6-dimethyltransferase RsmA/KsgA/DIM1 with predicted DNA glycosylase/AP lyase activity